MERDTAVAVVERDLDVDQLLRQAYAAHRDGALDLAERHYRAALQCDPSRFDALHLLGFLLHQRGRNAEALTVLTAAVQRNDGSAEAWSNHGRVLCAMARFGEALGSYERALTLKPSDPGFLNERAVVLLELGQAAEALADLDRALAISPDLAEAHGNRGNALVRLNRLQEAIASYESAQSISGVSAPLLANRAHALRRLDRPRDAIPDLERALVLMPNFAEAHFELGLARLTLGELRAGFKSYEWRWKTGRFGPFRRDFRSPPWTGEQAIAGKTVLLYAEQGFGDAIQFVRYAPLVAAMGASVVLEVERELAALVSRVDGVTGVVARGDTPPPFDFHAPLMSLPHIFGTEIASIPGDVPYLEAEGAAAARWAADLPEGRPLVGLAWAGRASHHNDSNRSIALERLAPLLRLATLQFISLQHDISGADEALLAGCNVPSLGPALCNFAEAAALISALDCVVSVDTAIAHLAGALAKPVIILLPLAADFRWLREREDCPWYPTAKLLRQQSAGDWDSVIARLAAALPGWVDEKRRRGSALLGR
jgi:tetratricopeptide (TPR) repeat protein